MIINWLVNILSPLRIELLQKGCPFTAEHPPPTFVNFVADPHPSPRYERPSGMTLIVEQVALAVAVFKRQFSISNTDRKIYDRFRRVLNCDENSLKNIVKI